MTQSYTCKGLGVYTCDICNEKVYGDENRYSYHFYLCHRERVEEFFEEDYYKLSFKVRAKYGTKENALKELLRIFEEMERKDKLLT